MTSHSSDFSYRKYSLEQLDNWVHDALNCEDLTPQDIYNTILNVVDESIEYHKTQLTKSINLLSLLKGHKPVDFETTVSTATEKDWEDFWEPTEEVSKEQWAHPESSLYKHLQYTEEEMDAMCEREATENDKDKCREYNLREAEYYRKRAELDAIKEQVRAAGGYDVTPGY